MPDYQNAKIYKLTSPSGLVYVGSTCQRLCKRKASHKEKYLSHKNGTHHYTTSCILFDEDENNVEITEIEKWKCNDIEELKKRERYWIENTICVNKSIPGRTQKEYNEANKDKIKKWMKEYRETHKDEIKHRKQVRMICECGEDIRKDDKARHMKTKKHIDYSAKI